MNNWIRPRSAFLSSLAHTREYSTASEDGTLRVPFGNILRHAIFPLLTHHRHQNWPCVREAESLSIGAPAVSWNPGPCRRSSLGHGANSLTTLRISFSIHKMGIITARTLQGCREAHMKCETSSTLAIVIWKDSAVAHPWQTHVNMFSVFLMPRSGCAGAKSLSCPALE